MTSEISSRFVKGLQANIAYWQQKTAHLADADMLALNPDFPNLLRAVQMGIQHAATRRNTAVLVCQVFFWIEQAGHWHNWLPLMSQLIAVLDDDTLRCNLYKQQGQLFRSSDQQDAAISALKKSASLASKLQNDVALAEANTHLCSVYRIKRAYADAESYGQTALQLLAHKPGVDKQVTAVLANLGLIALAQGAFDQAETQLSEAVIIGRAVQQPTQLARILNSLAIVLQRQGKLEAAKQAYEEALDLLEQSTSRVDKVHSLLSLGSLYVDMSRLDEAEALFFKAEKKLNDMPGHFPLRAIIANNLGNVLLEKGEPAAAEHYLRRSIKLRQQLNIRLPLANSYKSLAKALDQLGHSDQAIKAIDAALQILPDFDDDVWAKSLLQECETLRTTIRSKHR